MNIFRDSAGRRQLLPEVSLTKLLRLFLTIPVAVAPLNEAFRN